MNTSHPSKPQRSPSPLPPRRSASTRPLPSILSLVALLAFVGCTDPASTGTEETEGERALRVLQEGYSLLASNVAGLQHVDKAFLIKFETDRVQNTVQGISDYASELDGMLEAWAEASDAVRLDLEPLPEIERRKLAAVQRDRLISFAPVVGRTGANFQRTLLLSQSGALNQLRHLAEVIADAEVDDSRRQEMLRVAGVLDSLYDEVVVILNDTYFCHDDPEPSLNEG